MSRSLAKVLRHKAHDYGIQMDSDGYVEVNELINKFFKGNNKEGGKIPTLHDIKCVAEDISSHKKRFELIESSEGIHKIRATDKHSIG